MQTAKQLISFHDMYSYKLSNLDVHLHCRRRTEQNSLIRREHQTQLSVITNEDATTTRPALLHTPEHQH